MNPSYILRKTTAKTKNFSQQFMTDWEVNLLDISCEKKHILFWAYLSFSCYFQPEMKEKNLFDNIFS